MRPIGFLSELPLFREYLRILILFGLILGAAAPSFFSKTACNMSKNLSMVVESP
jgi:hypothetical protein